MDIRNEKESNLKMYEAHFKFVPRDIIELTIVDGSRLEVGVYEDYVPFLVQPESGGNNPVYFNVFGDNGRILRERVVRESEE